MNARRYVTRLALVLVAPLLAATFAATSQTIQLPRAVPAFNQAYTGAADAWGDCVLGTGGCPDRIRTTGCLITAFASVLAYFGIEVEAPAAFSCTGRGRTGMDPGILNDWLRARGGYGRCSQDPVGSCCLSWDRLPEGVVVTFHTNRSDVGVSPVASVVIDHALRQGNPVIAGVHWGYSCHAGTTQSEDCHWVVLTGRAGDTYAIVDPYNPDRSSPAGVRTTLVAGVKGSYIIDRFVVVSLVPGFVPSRPAPGEFKTAASASGTAAMLFALFAVVIAVAAVIFLTSRTP